MKVVVLGAGAMGQITILDLVESAAVKEVLIADLSLERANKLKTQLGSAKVKTVSVDISDVVALAKAISGYETVINCAPYYFNLKVMEAALKAGCHYLDLGGLFHTTRKQMELHKQFLAKGLLAVLGMGAAPGMTNVMAAAAASELESVEAIDIYAASVDLVSHNHPFLPPYALDTILDEYFLEPMVFENGEFIAYPPLSGEAVLEYPEPVGKASSFLTLHSEVATLPLSYANKGVRRVTYRLGLPEAFHERCKFLVELGFGAAEPMDVDGQQIKPRKVLAKMIEKHPVPQVDPDDCEVIRVDVSGQKNGREAMIRLETTVFSDKKWKVSCGALDTGVPPSIVAQMIGDGTITGRGVLAPEVCVPAQAFFSELAKRGMIMRMITDEALAGSGKKTGNGKAMALSL